MYITIFANNKITNNKDTKKKNKNPFIFLLSPRQSPSHHCSGDDLAIFDGLPVRRRPLEQLCLPTTVPHASGSPTIRSCPPDLPPAHPRLPRSVLVKARTTSIELVAQLAGITTVCHRQASAPPPSIEVVTFELILS